MLSTSKLRQKVEKSQLQSPSPNISFIQLNLDVLICIASNLDVISLSRLCQVNQFFNKFVENHGWKAWCITGQNYNIYRNDMISSISKKDFSLSSYKNLIQVDQAWESKIFRSYQSHLPLVTTTTTTTKRHSSNNGKERFERHPPQPLLLLAPLGLFLFTGSEMRFWTNDILQNLDSVRLDQAQIFYLTNPAGLDKQSSKNGNGGSSAIWDICACTQLDRKGQYIAIGRLNGLVEIIRVSRIMAKGGIHQTRQNQDAKVMMVNLVWVWRDVTCSTSIQSMHASPSSGLLVVAGKNGNIALFRLNFKGSNIKVNMVEHWNISSRPWSVWLEDSKWLAIGTNGSSPIILFTLDQKTLRPSSEGIRLSTGSNSKWTSVYAMKTKSIANECHLLAGCYDGTLRTYNVNRAFSDVYCSSPKSFLPISQHRDRFDPSAIYCLAIDVGKNGQEVAAGTARHGVCKFFPQQFNAPNREKDEGWSMFATSAHSSESPTYSLVGQFDRLFGVTDAVFWQLDLRPTNCLSADGNKDEHQNTMAYYRHGEIVIDHTRWPSI